MPTKDSVSAADLDRRIEIQAITSQTPDGQGGFTDVWTTVYKCAANIQNFPHGRGLFRAFIAQQLYPQVNLTIQIRFQRSVLIDATKRVRYVAHGVEHIYSILGVENTMEANVSMWLLCREDAAKAVN